ncbi:hypothetical protein FRB93_004852 [Tulasnella sp. JGI-2019a]|nr:hypothetical protein FRB93_004852 [Tulasnella sp. JGI-2019a]
MDNLIRNVCGTCIRSHAHALKLDPYTTPAEPECTYDRVEDIPENIKKKVIRLEREVAKLKDTLRERDVELAACICRPKPSADSALRLLRLQSTSSDRSQVAYSLPTSLSVSPTPSDPPNLLPTDPQIITYDNDLAPPTPDQPNNGPMTLSTAAWPPNIPAPELLHHLVETVFSCVPLASRLIHRPTFLANLQKPPTSVDFPHVNILHAICALASLYTPIVTHINPIDLNVGVRGAAMANAGVVNGGFEPYVPRRVDDREIDTDSEFDFASLHIRWCEAANRIALRRGDAVPQQIQACILGAWFHYSRGKFVHALGWSVHGARLVGTLGLNTSPGFEPLSRIPPEMLYALPPTQGGAELRRNLFWIAYSLERIINASNVWPMILDDANCSQIMPCSLNDFEASKYVSTQGRQHILSHQMLISHPPLATDSFTLYIKASILLGKVKTFNCRFRYRYTYGDPQLSDPATSLENEPTKIDPRTTEEFQALDRMTEDFLTSIPGDFKDPVGVHTGSRLDPTLYIAHILPHMASIALHDPHANVFSAHDVSAQKLLKAARAILDLIYKVSGTAFDLIFLDHASSTAWFVAGVTLIRFLAAKTAQKDEFEIERLKQELAAVRFILGNLGDRTGVGLRQIKLLEMVESIEMGPHSSANRITVTEAA